MPCEPRKRVTISLELHNRLRLAEIAAEKDRIENGELNMIACPNCGAELRDTPGGVILMSDPPLVPVRCPACQWHGERIT